MNIKIETNNGRVNNPISRLPRAWLFTGLFVLLYLLCFTVEPIWKFRYLMSYNSGSFWQSVKDYVIFIDADGSSLLFQASRAWEVSWASFTVNVVKFLIMGFGVLSFICGLFKLGFCMGSDSDIDIELTNQSKYVKDVDSIEDITVKKDVHVFRWNKEP